jgi:hypothetical protein
LMLTPSTARYWTVEFPQLFGQAFPYLDNQSLNALVSRALLPTALGLPDMQIMQAEWLRPGVTWLLNLLTLTACAGVLWAARDRTSAQTVKGQIRTVRLLLEGGLVLLTIHLVSGSTWLHHMVDLPVPLAALLGTTWLRYSAEGIGTGKRAALPVALIIGASLLLLLRRPGDWVSLLPSPAQANPFFVFIASNTGVWVLLLLWTTVAVALLRWTQDV